MKKELRLRVVEVKIASSGSGTLAGRREKYVTRLSEPARGGDMTLETDEPLFQIGEFVSVTVERAPAT